MDRVLAAVRRHWLFAVALAGAVALRVLAMLAFRPIMWFGGDSASYLATGLRLIPDPSRVGGYGFMLWALRPLHSFAAVAAVQHLAGIGIGVLIYRLGLRYRLPEWVAVLGAAPVLLDSYGVQLESDAVPDLPFGFMALFSLYLVLRPPGERRLDLKTRAAGAAFLLGVAAIFWPVGLALLVVLLVAVLVRRQGWRALVAAAAAGVIPVLGYAAWFDLHEHSFTLTRSEGVYLWSRTMSFADCAVIKPPADERALCPPAKGPRLAASLYIWDGNSPLLSMPGGRFSARTNSLALDFALRAIAAQPGGYLTAVGHDVALSFYWDRPVHPDAGIVDRYQFSDAATAWVPAGLRTIGGGTVAGDQAAYTRGNPAPTRAVRPFAGWLVSYQRYVYLPGTLLGVLVVGGLVVMIARRAWAAALPWAFAVTILVVPPMIADFDLRYLVPAVPAASLAAMLSFNRRCTTSPAATAVTDDDRTSSLPSESTPAASPESG